VHQIKQLGFHRLHPALDRTYRDILYEEPSPMYEDFLTLCVSEGDLRKDGDEYAKASPPGEADFQTMRSKKLATVIMNEVEPLTLLTGIIRTIAQTPRTVLSTKIRAQFIEEDLRQFDEDYAAFAKPDESKPPEVGRPFLLVPPRIRAGIVLVHGYMAAPLEVRALADHLHSRGYAVYGVRLKGHGTAPEDLARTTWEEWYESVNRGYAVIKSMTDDIILGGFSTGGVLAMLGAGRKRDHIRGVFSINAPLHLRNYMARFASTLVSMTNMIARIKRGATGWEFAESSPENRHINYFRNPIAGVKELGEAMDAMEAVLKDVCVPALVIQCYRDPIVDPSSGEGIFRRIGSEQKELILLNQSRHGIVNGEGSLEVFERVDRFLTALGVRARVAAPKEMEPADTAALGNVS
jgi:esterase/lipase